MEEEEEEYYFLPSDLGIEDEHKHNDTNHKKTSRWESEAHVGRLSDPWKTSGSPETSLTFSSFFSSKLFGIEAYASPGGQIKQFPSWSAKPEPKLPFTSVSAIPKKTSLSAISEQSQVNPLAKEFVPKSNSSYESPSPPISAHSFLVQQALPTPVASKPRLAVDTPEASDEDSGELEPEPVQTPVFEGEQQAQSSHKSSTDDGEIRSASPIFSLPQDSTAPPEVEHSGFQSDVVHEDSSVQAEPLDVSDLGFDADENYVERERELLLDNKDFAEQEESVDASLSEHETKSDDDPIQASIHPASAQESLGKDEASLHDHMLLKPAPSHLKETRRKDSDSRGDVSNIEEKTSILLSDNEPHARLWLSVLVYLGSIVRFLLWFLLYTVLVDLIGGILDLFCFAWVHSYRQVKRDPNIILEIVFCCGFPLIRTFDVHWLSRNVQNCMVWAFFLHSLAQTGNEFFKNCMRFSLSFAFLLSPCLFLWQDLF